MAFNESNSDLHFSNSLFFGRGAGGCDDVKNVNERLLVVRQLILILYPACGSLLCRLFLAFCHHFAYLVFNCLACSFVGRGKS